MFDELALPGPNDARASSQGGDEGPIIKGLQWVLQNVDTDWGNNDSSEGIDIITMSFGSGSSPVGGNDQGDDGNNSAARLVNNCAEAGIVPIAAIGNDGTNRVTSVGAADASITVGAIDDKNTIVVYTSDQGFYLGEHGWFDKRFIYDQSFKTPLLIKWPNAIKPGTTNEEMVQNLDFAQTFLEAAMIDAPNDMQGESLMPLLKGDNENWTRDAVYYHYYEYPSVHMAKRHYGIVNKEYKLVHFYYDIDEWELYDRAKDPNEMYNVYNDPEYKEIVESLTKELYELRIKYKDSEALDKRFLYN